MVFSKVKENQSVERHKLSNHGTSNKVQKTEVKPPNTIVILKKNLLMRSDSTYTNHSVSESSSDTGMKNEYPNLNVKNEMPTDQVVDEDISNQSIH